MTTRVDGLLDHLLQQQELHELRVTDLEWDCDYIAQLAQSMVHAPLEARQAVADEIRSVMVDLDLWKAAP